MRLSGGGGDWFWRESRVVRLGAGVGLNRGDEGLYNYQILQYLCVVLWGQTHNKFLSDAPFFGFSLCTEFKLPNCACVNGWSCLINLDLLS